MSFFRTPDIQPYFEKTREALGQIFYADEPSIFSKLFSQEPSYYDKVCQLGKAVVQDLSEGSITYATAVVKLVPSKLAVFTGAFGAICIGGGSAALHTSQKTHNRALSYFIIGTGVASSATSLYLTFKA